MFISSCLKKTEIKRVRRANFVLYNGQNRLFQSTSLWSKQYLIDGTLYNIQKQQDEHLKFYSKPDHLSILSIIIYCVLQKLKLESHDLVLHEWFMTEDVPSENLLGTMLLEKSKHIYVKTELREESALSNGWLAKSKTLHCINKLNAKFPRHT